MHKEIYDGKLITIKANNGTFQEYDYLNGCLENVYSVIGAAWERPGVTGDTVFIVEHDSSHPAPSGTRVIIHTEWDEKTEYRKMVVSNMQGKEIATYMNMGCEGIPNRYYELLDAIQADLESRNE